VTAVLVFLLAILSLALAAFCAGAETGFLSVRRGRIVHMAREGSRRAQIIQKAIQDMGRTTTALLVGNNLASVSYSSATAALTGMLLADFPIAASVVTALSALVLLFLGEFLPKLLCSARPLRRLLFLAPAWDAFERVFVPLGMLVQLLIERFLPRKEQKSRVTPESVLRILQDRKDGVRISDFESALIGRIMVLRSRGEFVTPDTLLSALDEDV